MELITSGTLKYLQKSFGSTRFIRGHPFYWTSKLGPDVDQSLVTRIHCSVNAILGLMYTCFVIFRSFQVLKDSGTTPTQLIYMVFVTVYYLLLLSYQVIVVVMKDDLVCFTRSFLRFIENRGRAIAGKSGGKVLKFWEFVLRITFWSLKANIPVLCALSILQPKSPEFISSLLCTEDHGVLNWIARSLSASFQTYLTICMVQAGLVCLLNTYFFIFITVELTERVKTNLKKMGLKNKTLVLRRCFVMVCKMRIYTEIRLLVDFYNDLFPRILVGGHIGCTIVTILCTHIAVRSEGWISVVCGYFGIYLFASLIMIMNLVAEVDRRSSSILEMMRERAGGDKILYRKVKSMRALRVRAGSYFFYDKMLVVTTAQIVLQNAISLLLMY